MAAVGRAGFEDAIQAIRALDEVSDSRRGDAEAHAWELLQPSVKAAKTSTDIILGHTVEVMCAVMAFLIALSARRKVLKAKAIECLRILLSEMVWLQAVAGAAGEFASLESSLRILLPDLDEMLAGVTGASADLGQTVQKPIMVGQDALEGDAREGKKLLAQSMRSMEKLEWTYPAPSRSSADRDAASEAFQAFASGVTKLSNFVARECAKKDAEVSLDDSLHDLSGFWPEVLHFLASTNQERRPFVSKVEFIVTNLSRCCSTFSDAVQLYEQRGGVGLLTQRSFADKDPEVASVAEPPAEESLTLSVNDEGDILEAPRDYDQAIAAPEILLSSPTWKPGSKLQWMWADARALPLPGMHKLAEMNPGRWSEPRTPEEVITELQRQPGSRRVQVRPLGKPSRKFADVEAAVEWICAPEAQLDPRSKTL